VARICMNLLGKVRVKQGHSLVHDLELLILKQDDLLKLGQMLVYHHVGTTWCGQLREAMGRLQEACCCLRGEQGEAWNLEHALTLLLELEELGLHIRVVNWHR
jgi:urease accessory protein UreH